MKREKSAIDTLRIYFNTNEQSNAKLIDMFTSLSIDNKNEVINNIIEAYPTYKDISYVYELISIRDKSINKITDFFNIESVKTMSISA